MLSGSLVISESVQQFFSGCHTETYLKLQDFGDNLNIIYPYFALPFPKMQDFLMVHLLRLGETTFCFCNCDSRSHCWTCFCKCFVNEKLKLKALHINNKPFVFIQIASHSNDLLLKSDLAPKYCAVLLVSILK